jgi:hypothetical protein
MNVTKLLDYLPQIDDNRESMLRPITICDRGYGKKTIISILAERNYKVLTIASNISSKHPIIGSTIVQSNVDKIKNTDMSNTDWLVVMECYSPM